MPPAYPPPPSLGRKLLSWAVVVGFVGWLMYGDQLPIVVRYYLGR